MTKLKLQNILVRKISKIDDVKSLNEIYKFIEIINEDDKVYKLNTEQKKLIKKSEKEFEEGKYLDNELVFRKIDKWLKEK